MKQKSDLGDLVLNGGYAGDLFFLRQGLVCENSVDFVLLVGKSLLAGTLCDVLLALDLDLGCSLVLQNVHENGDDHDDTGQNEGNVSGVEVEVELNENA